MGNLFAFAGPCSRVQWRNPDNRLNWSTEFKKTLIDEIKALHLHHEIKPCILLAGPVGAGKSSIVNSFLTAGAERLIRKAEPGSDGASVTTKFMRYDGIPQLEKYRICDTTGILDRDNKGLHPKDVLNLMKGHIRSGYQFKEDEPISEEDEQYVETPNDLDRSHCLALVIPSTKVKDMSNGYRERLMNAIRSSRSQGIPTVIILTQLDRCCVNVMQNPTKVFTCEHIKEVVEIAQEKLGLPEGFIFPMTNYASQLVKDERLDIINLLILKKILEFTSDHIEGPGKQ